MSVSSAEPKVYPRVIPAGTILYHGSSNRIDVIPRPESFFGEDAAISLAVMLEKPRTGKGPWLGYLHRYVVTRDISVMENKLNFIKFGGDRAPGGLSIGEFCRDSDMDGFSGPVHVPNPFFHFESASMFEGIEWAEQDFPRVLLENREKAVTSILRDVYDQLGYRRVLYRERSREVVLCRPEEVLALASVEIVDIDNLIRQVAEAEYDFLVQYGQYRGVRWAREVPVDPFVKWLNRAYAEKRLTT